MTQAPRGPMIEVKPQPNIYTVLLVAAIIVLAVTLGLVVWNLLAPSPKGYGMEPGDLLKPVKSLL